MARRPGWPARWVRRLRRSIGLHPERVRARASWSTAVLLANHGWLDIGQPTGVFASWMTVASYLFLNAAATAPTGS